MPEIDVYKKIAEKLGAPVSERFLKVLEATFTPEEGTVLLELFSPATCREVAARLKTDEKRISGILKALVDRGVITNGKTQYAFHTSVLAFHHDVVGDPAVEPVPENIKKAWADFFYNEWSDLFVQSYIQRQQATGRPVHRVWPAIGALELSPNIKPEQILPEEDFRLTIRNAKRRIIAPCGCRKVWGKCDHPLDTCFACFDNPRGEYYLDKPGRTLKELSLEETLALVRRNEEAGLVHIGVCYCCPDACEILYSLKTAGRFDLLAPSRYCAAVDEEKCIGCQDCVDRCVFDAVEMVKPAGSRKLKASIIAEKCMGCGACIVGCQQKAMRYELVRPPEYIKAPTPARPSAGQRPGGMWGFYDLQ